MENPEIRQNYLKMLMVWSTLMSSQVLFFAIVTFNKPGLFPPDLSAPLLRSGNEAAVIASLAFLAICNVAISVFIKVSGTRKALSERNPSSLQTALVIGCAMCETTSVFGMILAFGFEYQFFFVWFIAGVLGILYHFPSKANVRLATLKG